MKTLFSDKWVCMKTVFSDMRGLHENSVPRYEVSE